MHFVELNELLCFTPPVLPFLKVKEPIFIKIVNFRPQSNILFLFFAHVANLVFATEEACLCADHLFNLVLYSFHLLVLALFRCHFGKKGFLGFRLVLLRSDVLVNNIFYFEACLSVHFDILFGNSLSKLAFKFDVVLVEGFDL